MSPSRWLMMLAVPWGLSTGGCAAHTAQVTAPTESAAGARAAKDLLPSPEMLEKMHFAEAVGTILYLEDKASAIGTDVMLAHIKEPAAEGIRGWLTIRNATEAGEPLDSWSVFFLTDEDTPRIVCTIIVPLSGKPVFTRHEPPLVASPDIGRTFRARQTALAAVPRNGQPINTVMVPAAAVGARGQLVYLLAGTKTRGEVVFGMHYRALLSEDGLRVVEMKPLSQSVIILREEDLPPGAEPVAFNVAHVISDWPLETDVFVSLLHKRPVNVITRVGMWQVDGNQIHYLGPNESSPERDR